MNNFLKSFLDDSYCGTLKTKDDEQFIDFRKLFNASSSFGDLFALAKNIIDEQLLSSSKDGGSKINNVIQSLTESNSNEIGTLYSPGDLFEQSSEINLAKFQGAIDIRVSNLRIKNLDSVDYPIAFLNPNQSNSLITEIGKAKYGWYKSS